MNKGWMKWVLLLGLSVTGITVGIVAGYLVLGPKLVAGATQGRLRASYPYALKIGDGEPFPFERLIGSDTSRARLIQSVVGHRVVVHFTTASCDACQEHLTKWKNEMSARIDSAVVQIFCVEQEEGEEDSAVSSGPNSWILPVDYQVWKNRYNLSEYPTIVASNRRGEVEHIQYGLKGSYDVELTNLCLSNGQA